MSDLISNSVLDYLPIRYRSLVCLHSDNFKTRTYNKNHMNFCGECHKPLRWYLQRCKECKSWFIKDFYRYPMCPTTRHTACWSCLNEVDPCECKRDYRLLPKPELSSWDFGPLGLNPRKLTREELDAAFDWVSPF